MIKKEKKSIQERDHRETSKRSEKEAGHDGGRRGKPHYSAPTISELIDQYYLCEP